MTNQAKMSKGLEHPNRIGYKKTPLALEVRKLLVVLPGEVSASGARRSLIAAEPG